MFDVLIYTDCTAEESVNGRTGFQFMAESEGVSPSDEEVVRTGLFILCRPALIWIDPSFTQRAAAIGSRAEGST